MTPFALLESGIPLTLLLDLRYGPHSQDLLRHELSDPPDALSQDCATPVFPAVPRPRGCRPPLRLVR